MRSTVLPTPENRCATSDFSMLAALYSESRSNDTLPVCLSENTNRLVSLWDIMKRFHAADYGHLIERLTILQQTTAALVALGQGGSEAGGYLDELREIASVAKSSCEDLGFEEGQATAFLVSMRAEPSTIPVTVSHIESESVHLKDALLREAFYRNFFMVERSYSEYLYRDSLFGARVTERFPSAVYDIREAGNCLAMDRNTATVFHLMRAAEYGLRALARDRRITLPKNGVLDLASWEEIIKKLEDAELAIQKYPKTVARESQYLFYHGAMMEFRRFKNSFRNRVMHTREEYDANQAMSAFVHVRSFFQILAARISETTRTPIIWRGEGWHTMEGE